MIMQLEMNRSNNNKVKVLCTNAVIDWYHMIILIHVRATSNCVVIMEMVCTGATTQ